MQRNNNKPNRSYTPNKNYNTNAQEPEQPRTELSNLFKAPVFATQAEAEAERDRLYGRTPLNTNVSSTFTK
jgi:hypothetical protein